MTHDDDPSTDNARTTVPPRNRQIRRAPHHPDPLEHLNRPLLVPMASRTYNRQFAAIYDYRLRKLKHPQGRLLAAAHARWVQAGPTKHNVQRRNGAACRGGEGASRHHSRVTPSSSASSSTLPSSKTNGKKPGTHLADDDDQDDDDDDEEMADDASQPPPRPHYVRRILDIRQGDVCYVVGTIYCAMRLKPDALEELTREQWLPPQPARTSYVQSARADAGAEGDVEADEVYVEDESGRVRLVGEAVRSGSPIRKVLITGIVVALLGTETRAGHFEVIDALLPGLPPRGAGRPSVPRRPPLQHHGERNGSGTPRGEAETGRARGGDEGQDDDGEERPTDTYIALVSGLELGAGDRDSARATAASVAHSGVGGTAGGAAGSGGGGGGGSTTSLSGAGSAARGKARDERTAMAQQQNDMADEAGGELGYARREMLAQLLCEWLLGEVGGEEDVDFASRVVGLVIAGNSMVPPTKGDEEKEARTLPPTAHAYPTATLDRVLSTLSSSLPVYLLPGERDAASVALPQQPLHAALLPRARRFESFTRCTNPAWIGAEGLRLLGSSGQTIDDLFKYLPEETSSDRDRLVMACRTLEWSHVAPTAPDTLYCFPFTDRDPFLLEEAPDVYFIGNQPRFDTCIFSADDTVGRASSPSTRKGTKRRSSASDDDGDEGGDGDPDGAAAAKTTTTTTRVVLLPRFCDSAEVVLLNTRTLGVSVVRLEVEE